jgi:hypothetical protein
MGQPPGAPPGGEKKKSKTGLIIGGCCVLLLLIGCGVGGYMYWAAQQAATSLGTSIEVEANRISLSLALSGVQSSCTTDPSGASAASYFHPNVFATYQAQACMINDDVVNAFGDATRATGVVAAGSGDEAWATAVAADASQCYSFTSGSAKVVACTLPEGFKIVHLENITMVQPPG